MRISVAIPAYNEAQNIAHLIDAVRYQTVRETHIVEIVVVASGCTDATEEIVRRKSQEAGTPVRLIVEPRRSGKVAALNTYFSQSKVAVDAVCVCSADLFPAPEALEQLVAALARNPKWGMVGGRPLPTNNRDGFLGVAAHFLWNMHHRVALEAPKLGEMVLLRAGIVNRLPPESSVDEATLEQLVCQAGYQLGYVPSAIVHNHAPHTTREFIRQRRRIASGHFWLRYSRGYAVSTMDPARTIRLTLAELKGYSFYQLCCALGMIAIEVVSRCLGWVDCRRRRPLAVWKISTSTKKVVTKELEELYQFSRPDSEAFLEKSKSPSVARL